MEIRHATHPDELAKMSDDDIRQRFVISDLFTPGAIKAVYSHEDRMVLGGVHPEPGTTLDLENYPSLRAEYFCQRRELAVTGISGTGTVTVDGEEYVLESKDVLYIGQGSKKIQFGATQEGTRLFLSSAVSQSALPYDSDTSCRGPHH